MAITLSVLNGFSKLLSLFERDVNFQQNPYSTSTTLSVCCSTTLQKL